MRTESMTTIQKILFPVDFSVSCVAMAACVKREAAMFSAKVTLRSRAVFVRIRAIGATAARDRRRPSTRCSGKTEFIS